MTGDSSQPVLAYAVECGGVVDAATVHGHPRGVMVNWLHKNRCPVTNRWTDEQIRAEFLRWAPHARAEPARLVVVRLAVVREEDPAQTDLLAPPGPA